MSLDNIRVEQLLYDTLGKQDWSLNPIDKGLIKQVFHVESATSQFILSISEHEIDHLRSKLLDKLLLNLSVPYKKLISCGKVDHLFYEITNYIPGVTLSDKLQDFKKIESDLISSLQTIHNTDISNYTGYGFLDPVNGTVHNTMSDFIEGFFAPDIDGYWKNWTELFNSTFLDREIFYNILDELRELEPKVNQYRYLIHGDFHSANILTDGNKITGIIDWDNAQIGDFLHDIIFLQMELHELNILDNFLEVYKQQHFDLTNLDLRCRAQTLLIALDSLRFCAKTDNIDGYNGILKYIGYKISK